MIGHDLRDSDRTIDLAGMGEGAPQVKKGLSPSEKIGGPWYQTAKHVKKCRPPQK